MGRSVRLNNRGFTLVEMLIALVIILLVLLGLVQAAMLSIEHNLRNLLREEAVGIAGQRMDGDLIDTTTLNNPGLRTLAFSDARLNAGTNCFTVARNFRNIENRNFTVCTTITNIPNPAGGSVNAKNVQVYVGWNFKGQEGAVKVPTGNEYQHSIATILRSPT